MKYKLGIIGYPLGHSISPIIQKAGLESVGLDADYDILETSAEDLVDRIKYLRVNGYNGFNVTIPHKIPISFFVNDMDNYANIAGCINTVKITGDHKDMYGYNTDIYGCKSAIPEDIDLKGKSACVLGTGGASRAASVGLIEKGITSIHYYTRNIINSEKTINYLRDKFPNVKFSEIGFLNVVKQAADITDSSKLDELYVELCERYDIQQDFIHFNKRKADFMKVVNENI
jgi:shikimate dehydrogenase